MGCDVLSGVTPEEMEKVRPRLEAFAEEMLGSLQGGLYVRGLMLDGKRKSMQPMAERLGVDHQQLQQFVSSSASDWTVVRERLGRWAAAHLSPRAYAVDDVGFPKDGSIPGCGTDVLRRAGQARQLPDRSERQSGFRRCVCCCWLAAVPARELGRCQELRRRCLRKPSGAAGRRPAFPGAGGTGRSGAWPWTRSTRFTGREGLTERGLAYAVAVKGTTSAHLGDAVPERPPYPGRCRPPVHAYPAPPAPLRQLALNPGRSALRTVTWRDGSRTTKSNPRAEMHSRLLALRVRPANRQIRRHSDGSLPECWMLAEWPPGPAEPTDYWLSTLSAGLPLRDLVHTAKIRWRIEHDYRELKDGLGLDHFEGRSFSGWHRHVTLACLAQAFCTLLRLDPKVPAPA